MCYSESASWGAAAVGVAGMAAYSAKTSDDACRSHISRAQTVGLQTGFLSLILMQVYEALMWRQLRTQTPRHRTLERAAMVTNVAQPLAFGAVALFALGGSVDATTRTGLSVLLGAYAVAAAGWSVHHWNKLRAAAADDCGNLTCRLRWDWLGNGTARTAFWAFYMVALIAPLALLPRSPLNIVLPVAVLATYGVSSYMGEPHGSKWCFIAVALPWIITIVYKPLPADTALRIA